MKSFDENHRLKKKNSRVYFSFLSQETVEMLCAPSLLPEPSTLFYNSTCRLSSWVCGKYVCSTLGTLVWLYGDSPTASERTQKGLTHQHGHQVEHSQFLCNFNFSTEISIWPKEGKTYCQLYMLFFFFLFFSVITLKNAVCPIF